MAKLKQLYVCTSCGSQSSKWIGQCPDCQAWNTLVEEVVQVGKFSNPRLGGYAAASDNRVLDLASVSITEQARQTTGSTELDRVLGGGLVQGSVCLIGGDPGIGKSTLLLQTACQLSQSQKVLYVTGEESLQQVSLRAQRLELPTQHVRSLAETQVERIIDIAKQEHPQVMVIDSIQTMFTDLLQSAPGSVSQVRESAALLVAYAKQTGTAIFLVGHVTKEGNLAGPRVLEHMVDCVLYFEGQTDSRYRIIRAIKNRFGAVNELGIFAMTDKGLREVSNPSAIFLSRYEQAVAGSVVMTTWEGSRPMLVEIQALVSESHLGNPRRITVGLEQNRLAMLLAVLQRHGGITTYDQDVFVNVVGGMRIMETAADLAIALAVLSSLRNKPIDEDLIVFGEIGLAGEIRPVQSGQERLREAAKHGFKKAIVPFPNLPKVASPIEVIGAKTLNDALALL
jgi:DNA repair protein RadA/Sms